MWNEKKKKKLEGNLWPFCLLWKRRKEGPPPLYVTKARHF